MKAPPPTAEELRTLARQARHCDVPTIAIALGRSADHQEHLEAELARERAWTHYWKGLAAGTHRPKGSAMDCHNHGPEEGAGLACRESRIGDCLRAELQALREPRPKERTYAGTVLRGVADTIELCIDALEGRDGADVPTELDRCQPAIRMVREVVDEMLAAREQEAIAAAQEAR